MVELSQLLNYLENKYEQPLTLEEYLVNKYGILNNTTNNVAIPQITEAQEVVQKNKTEDELKFNSYLFFSCDREGNSEIVEQLISSIATFEMKVFQYECNEVASKLIGNYVKELKKLFDSKSLSEGEKTADKYVKILKKTLMKLWGNRYFSDEIRKYFRQNKIQIQEYEMGHKISDDEFEMLDETLIGALSVKSEKVSDKYKVIEMTQPIVRIYYIDEYNELDFKLVPGSCKFYV